MWHYFNISGSGQAQSLNYGRCIFFFVIKLNLTNFFAKLWCLLFSLFEFQICEFRECGNIKSVARNYPVGMSYWNILSLNMDILGQGSGILI